MTEAPWKQIDFGQQRWWVDPNWSQQLLDQDGLRLQQWRDQGQVEIIKHSEQRTVYRIGLPNKSVFIKHYPARDLRSRLRLWLRQAKAWIEWQRTIELKQRAVPTITPVAVGMHPEHGSYFITEEIPSAYPLHSYVQEHWPRWKQAGLQDQCHTLIQEAGQFLARMLHVGIVHQDLHAGNILIHTDASGMRHWFLIDPYEVKSQLRISRSALLQSLALISQSYWPQLSNQERLRAWISFKKASQITLPHREERLLLRNLEREVQRRTYALWKQRGKRCTKANRDFYELRLRRCHGWAHQAMPADWLSKWMFDPGQILMQPSAQLLKRSRHGLVARINDPVRPLLLKKIVPRHSWDRLMVPWRGSPALHCYRMSYLMELAQLPTARALAVFDHRGHDGRLDASYVLSEYLDKAIPVSAYWTHATARERMKLQQRLAQVISRMHQFHLSHRDMKLANILVMGHEPYLIDMCGVSQPWWLSQTRRSKDLARLALSAITLLGLSRSACLRFLRYYLPTAKRQQWKPWWRMISRRMQNKVEQNRRRQRPVS